MEQKLKALGGGTPLGKFMSRRSSSVNDKDIDHGSEGRRKIISLPKTSSKQFILEDRSQ